MARNTRTFSDIDLNFRPVPSAYDRIYGYGTIVVDSSSKTIVGTNTRFQTLLKQNDNIYVKGSFIGKVESIQSETQLTLYDTAKITRTVDIHDINDYNYTISSPIQYQINADGHQFYFNVNKDILTEGTTVTFSITTNSIENGYTIPYIVHGIQREDLVLLTETDSDLTGNFIFTNNVATVTFRIAEDVLVEILEQMVLELVGYTYIIPEASYTYSTPGDISIKTDENAIKASIRNLISTMNYERPFNSKVGSQARNIFFELATPMTPILIKKSVTDVIRNFEPRVNVNDVQVSINAESHDAYVTVYFTIINTIEPLQVTVLLERTR